MRGEAKREGEREGRKRTKGKNVKQIQKESPNLQNTNYGRTQVDSQDPSRHHDQSQVEKKTQKFHEVQAHKDGTHSMLDVHYDGW